MPTEELYNKYKEPPTMTEKLTGVKSTGGYIVSPINRYRSQIIMLAIGSILVYYYMNNK